MEIHLKTTDYIQGIGPTISETLANMGVHFLSDFFVYNPQNISLHTGFSIERIEEWRAAAAFIEIEDMTPDWAEALVKAGKLSYDRFLFSSLEEIEGIFEEALANSIIPEVPNTEMIYLLTKRISRGVYGNNIQGIVKDEQGNPLEGAEVNIAQYKTKTNSKGHWRFAAMNAKSPVRLFIMKEDFETHYNDSIELGDDPFSIDVYETALSPGTSMDIILDEFNGDELPELTSYNTSTKKMNSEDLREGDVLRVHKIENGIVRLVSIYSQMVNQTFTILVYEVDEALLTDAAVNSYWKYKNEQFTLTGDELGSIAILKKTRNVLSNVRSLEEDEDPLLFLQQPIDINLTP